MPCGFVVVILFGLAMDYGVFLVSRIHEDCGHRHDPDAAIRRGMGSSARVVSDAVRVTLVPAVLTLLGNAAWALPRWLDRLLPTSTWSGRDSPRPRRSSGPRLPDDERSGPISCRGRR
ncbi:MAG: MMPL family transporter [Pseudonocardiales bacterium]